MTIEISIIIYISLLAFFYLGTKVLSLNNRSILNRAFFGLSLAAATWSFTFSVANVADSYEMALFWRRVSTFGWGVFFSLQLDFALVLTLKTYLFKNKWLYALIYAPALINLWVFGIYSPIANRQYNLIKGDFGWVHVTENTPWEIYFRFYYITFMLITLALFLRWGYLQKNLKVRRKGYIISGGILVGLILGSLTNFIANDLFSTSIPQLEPVFIIIPMLIIYFSLDDFGLKLSSSHDQTFLRGKYLSKETHEKLLVLISELYMIIAYIVFGFRYFINHDSVAKILPTTILSFSIGATIIFLMSANQLSNKVDSILKIILITSIPVISWLQFDIFVNFGIAVPVMMILLSVSFNDSKLTRNIMFISIATLIIAWVVKPSVKYNFSQIDHASRIVVFIIIGYVSLFINKIYTQRITHIEKQIEADIYFRESVFMTGELNGSNMHFQIKKILEQSCLYSGADGAFVILSDPNKNSFYDFNKSSYSHEMVDSVKSALKAILEQDIENRTKHHYEEKIMKNPILNALRHQFYLKYLIENAVVKGFFVLFNTNNALLLNPIVKSAISYSYDRLGTAISKVLVDEKVRKLIYEDEITGLSTRHALNEYMDDLTQMNKDFAFILISINNLNVINESMGYNHGDLMLKDFGEFIDHSIDVEHFTARFFSGIFAIVLPNYVNKVELCTKLEYLITVLNKSLKFNSMPNGIKLSIGVSIYQANQSDLCDVCSYDVIQQHADLALSYSDEQHGSIVFYDEALQNAFMETLSLEADIEKALNENQFVLYYQPKVNIMTRKIVGFEALIRWNHPTKGIIPPLQFLPLAEKNGLIKQIDIWVLKKACHQNHIWQEMGLPKLKMSVNFTPLSLMDQNTVQQLFDYINHAECNSHALEIEITETASFYLADPIIEILSAIRNKGIDVAMDDFGIEYSSLSRLHHLPIDHLKIDKEFIDNAVLGERSAIVLANIIRLGHDLNLEMTAEGVETEQQVNLLKQLGCVQAQGYYFYKPMPANEIQLILEKEKNV